jgi:hypothetical protein
LVSIEATIRLKRANEKAPVAAAMLPGLLREHNSILDRRRLSAGFNEKASAARPGQIPRIEIRICDTSHKLISEEITRFAPMLTLWSKTVKAAEAKRWEGKKRKSRLRRELLGM